MSGSGAVSSLFILLFLIYSGYYPVVRLVTSSSSFSSPTTASVHVTPLCNYENVVYDNRPCSTATAASVAVTITIVVIRPAVKNRANERTTAVGDGPINSQPHHKEIPFCGSALSDSYACSATAQECNELPVQIIWQLQTALI